MDGDVVVGQLVHQYLHDGDHPHDDMGSFRGPQSEANPVGGPSATALGVSVLHQHVLSSTVQWV